jgi:hypothetical protein
LLFIGCINTAPYLSKLCLLYSFGPSFFQTKQAILVIPKNATATGNFGNDTQSINISWLNENNKTNQFIIFFVTSSTENRYMIRNITVNVTTTKEEFPDFKGKLKG